MKNSIYLFFVLLLLFSCKGNDTLIQSTNKVVQKEASVLDMNNIYNYHTNRKIAFNEFMAYTNGQRFNLIREYDSYANPIKFYLDTADIMAQHKVFDKVVIGEQFPETNISTFKGESFTWNDDLKGNNLVFHFDHFIEGNDYTINSLEDMETLISSHNDEVIGVVFLGIIEDELSRLSIESSPLKFAQNGKNFQSRFNISNIPTTVVVNSMGIVVDIFVGRKEIHLDNL